MFPALSGHTTARWQVGPVVTRAWCVPLLFVQPTHKQALTYAHAHTAAAPSIWKPTHEQRQLHQTMAALQMSSPYESATCVVKPVTGTLPRKSDGAPSAQKELKLTVQLQEQDSRRQCCCKSDGTRFAGADTTIKLCQDLSYLISITTTPAAPLSVQQAEVKHRLAHCEEPSMCCCWPCAGGGGYREMEDDTEWSAPCKVPVTARSAASSAGKSAYELVWTCDMELTRSGLRGEVMLDLAVAGFGVVCVPLMAKVYRHDDASASHGIPLHSISYQYGKSGLTGEVRLYNSTYNK